VHRRVPAAVLIVIAGLGVTWFVLSRPSPSGSIKTLATRKALGLTIGLVSCTRLPDGQIEVNLTVAGPKGGPAGSDMHIGDVSMTSTSTEAELTGSEWGGPPDEPTSVTAKFTLSAPAGTVNVSLPVHIHRPDKVVSFKFADVSRADLPQSRTVKGHTVTLVAALDNCTPQYPPWTCKVVYNGSSPGTARECFGLQVKASLPQNFEEDNERESLTDSQGRATRLSSVYAQIFPSGLHLPVSSVRHVNLTLPEKVVGVASPGTALRMMSKRLASSATSVTIHPHPNGNFIYAYPVASQPKGKFTFAISGRLFADKKDSAVVEFKNVPVR